MSLHIRQSRSLKEKRRVLNRIKDRLRAKFNVSVAEVDRQDNHQIAELGIAAVGADRGYLDGLLDKALDRIRMDSDAGVTGHEKEWA